MGADGRTFAFDNNGVGYDDEAGTTFTFRLAGPQYGRVHRFRRITCPTADIVIDETRTTGVVEPVGGTWRLADPEHDLLFEIRTEETRENDQALATTIIRRRVYRLGRMDISFQ